MYDDADRIGLLFRRLLAKLLERYPICFAISVIRLRVFILMAGVFSPGYGGGKD